jgi:hypothetical protein
LAGASSTNKKTIDEYEQEGLAKRSKRRQLPWKKHASTTREDPELGTLSISQDVKAYKQSKKSHRVLPSISHKKYAYPLYNEKGELLPEYHYIDELPSMLMAMQKRDGSRHISKYHEDIWTTKQAQQKEEPSPAKAKGPVIPQMNAYVSTEADWNPRDDFDFWGSIMTPPAPRLVGIEPNPGPIPELNFALIAASFLVTLYVKCFQLILQSIVLIIGYSLQDTYKSAKNLIFNACICFLTYVGLSMVLYFSELERKPHLRYIYVLLVSQCILGLTVSTLISVYVICLFVWKFIANTFSSLIAPSYITLEALVVFAVGTAIVVRSAVAQAGYLRLAYLQTVHPNPGPSVEEMEHAYEQLHFAGLQRLLDRTYIKEQLWPAALCSEEHLAMFLRLFTTVDVDTTRIHSLWIRLIALRTIEKNPGPYAKNVRRRRKTHNGEAATSLSLVDQRAQESGARDALQMLLEFEEPPIPSSTPRKASAPQPAAQADTPLPAANPPSTSTITLVKPKDEFWYVPYEGLSQEGYTFAIGLTEELDFFVRNNDGYYVVVPEGKRSGAIVKNILDASTYRRGMAAHIPGVYKTQAKGHVYLEPAFRQHKTPAIASNSFHISAACVIICIPALSMLYNTYPTTVLSTNNYAGYLGLLKQKYPSLPLHITVGTAQVFVTEQYIRSQSFLTPGNLFFTTAAKAHPMTTSFVQPLGLDEALVAATFTGGVDFGGISRIYAIEDTIPMNLTDNRQFTVLQSVGYNFVFPKDEEGHQPLAGTFNTLTLPKAVSDTPARHYATRFCSVIGTKHFQLLEDSPNNKSLGLYRMYQARQPEGTTDAQLRLNQASLMSYLDYPAICHLVSNSPKLAIDIVAEAHANHTPLQACVAQNLAGVPSKIAKEHWFLIPAFNFMLLLLSFLYYPLSIIEAGFARLNQVMKPHPKRRLYQSWLQTLISIGSNSYHQIILEAIKVKNKMELAKPGKHIRLYVSYGIAYMNASFIYEFIKKLCIGTYDLVHMKLPFAVQIRVLTALDTSVMLDPYYEGLQILIYSDDMAFMFRHGTFEFKGDCDISACDAGNTFAIFGVLYHALKTIGFGELVRNNFHVLRQPLLIENPLNKRGKFNEYVKVKPVHMFQGSGCPETTVVNCFASLSIAMAMAYKIGEFINSGQPLSELDMTTLLPAAAQEVGHVITVKPCTEMEETTFLKHSPMRTEEGVYVNMLNLGAVLRSFGTYMGDLEAKSLNMTPAAFRRLDGDERVERYLGGIVKGLVHEPSNIIMDALRRRFKKGSSLQVRYFPSTYDRSSYTVPVSSLQARYEGSDTDWAQLATQLENLKFGEIRYAPIWDRIMAVDYGL